MVQIEKARRGGEPRFIDQHTTSHLDWHTALLKELKAAAKSAGVLNPSSKMLRAMAKDIADGKSKLNLSIPIR